MNSSINTLFTVIENLHMLLTYIALKKIIFGIEHLECKIWHRTFVEKEFAEPFKFRYIFYDF